MRTTEHHDDYDVLVIGAGLSGIGAACHLQRACPDERYAVLEARDAIGGTWDLFRYPGVRSDSDMHTLGYEFAPWKDARTLADGPSILRYIRETADAHGVTEHIRFGHRVVRADWDSAAARWTVCAERGDAAETVVLTCRLLYMCTGYYRYDHGHAPDFPGADRFGGELVHPQQWPQDLAVAGRRIVVIGSGATAVTLVPALAAQGAQVTMLQRSPTYVMSLPSEDPLAKRARGRLPETVAYHLVRWKNVAQMTLSYQFCRRRPRAARALLRKAAAGALPEGFDVDTHFSPRYEPWDQRLCFCPDDDLFHALGSGQAEIVTDAVQAFTERGIVLLSGRELEADVVVTATGLSLLALGGAVLSVDGRDVSLPDTIAYKAMMLGGVPNFAFAIGYTNASWTLKADLTSRYVCRLLAHMRRHGDAVCVPELPDGSVGREPLIGLASGYVQRSVADFPSQGDRRPWRVHQSYPLDTLELRWGRIDDGVMRFGPAGSAPRPAVGAPVAASAQA
jgi:cation diffusion facilitator CzcD-associated flavoprotein CzcO